jgi:hypothetical protein
MLISPSLCLHKHRIAQSHKFYVGLPNLMAFTVSSHPSLRLLALAWFKDRKWSCLVHVTALGFLHQQIRWEHNFSVVPPPILWKCVSSSMSLFPVKFVYTKYPAAWLDPLSNVIIIKLFYLHVHFSLRLNLSCVYLLKFSFLSAFAEWWTYTCWSVYIAQSPWYSQETSTRT